MRRKETVRLMALAAGIGVVAGLRSMTAPAVVGWGIQKKWIRAPKGRLRFLSSRKSAMVLSALALGELVVDKLPATPDRTKTASLIVRAASGAFCGAVLCASKRKLVVPAALFGAAGAIGGSFGGYGLRKKMDEKLAIPDAVIAVAEDALASGGGALLLRSA